MVWQIFVMTEKCKMLLTLFAVGPNKSKYLLSDVNARARNKGNTEKTYVSEILQADSF